MLIMQPKYLVNDFHVPNTAKDKAWLKALNNFTTRRLPDNSIWIQTSGFCKARHVQAETGVESNPNTSYSTNIKKLPALCVGDSKVAWTGASCDPEYNSMTERASETMWQPVGCRQAFAVLRKDTFCKSRQNPKYCK